MSDRGERVSNIVKLARGDMSQRAFGMELGVSASSTALGKWGQHSRNKALIKYCD